MGRKRRVVGEHFFQRELTRVHELGPVHEQVPALVPRRGRQYLGAIQAVIQHVGGRVRHIAGQGQRVIVGDVIGVGRESDGGVVRVRDRGRLLNADNWNRIVMVIAILYARLELPGISWRPDADQRTAIALTATDGFAGHTIRIVPIIGPVDPVGPKPEDIPEAWHRTANCAADIKQSVFGRVDANVALKCIARFLRRVTDRTGKCGPAV